MKQCLYKSILWASLLGIVGVFLKTSVTSFSQLCDSEHKTEHVLRSLASDSKAFFLKPRWAEKKNKKIKLQAKNMKKFVFPVDRFTSRFTQADMIKIVPTNLNPSSDASSILSVIADRGVSYWLNSEEMKNTPLVRTTKEVQEKLKTDVVLKGTQKNQIDHKFTMRYEAFQAMAKVEYQGWFKASVDYKPAEEQTQVSIHEKVFNNKELHFQQSFKKTESTSMIGLGWRW